MHLYVGQPMNRSLIERFLIAIATVCGAVLCVWWSNSIFPLLLIAAVVYFATMRQRTDHGEALRETVMRPGAQRRTRRRDDE